MCTAEHLVHSARRTAHQRGPLGMLVHGMSHRRSRLRTQCPHQLGWPAIAPLLRRQGCCMCAAHCAKNFWVQ
jgi:hypothetical protein